MSRILFLTFFLIFLESPETYAVPGLNKIEVELNFLSIFFVDEYLKSQKLKRKILLNENILKKSENSSCKHFRTLRIFWDQELNLTTFEGGVGGLDVVL